MADILSIGSSGLSAYRKSLEVTGNNIVNANTDGYTRRSAQLVGVGEASSGPTTLNASSGSGVNVDVINRATDSFVQSEMRLAQSNSAEATALSDRLSRLEKSMFSGSGDIGTLAQTFFSSMQDFATTPSSIPVRATVLQAADNLASGFRTQATTLAQESDAVVSDANDQLTQLNSLTKQLADLNSKLDQLSDTKGGSNDLLDQRDELINNIGKIATVTTSTRPSGATNIYLGDSTGSPALVDQTGAKSLAASRIDGHVQITLDPYGASTPLPSATGGTLGGIVAYDDQISMLKNQLDQLAAGFAKAVNDQHQKGVDLNGNQGGALYSPNTFTVAAAPTNKGQVSAQLDVSNVQSIGAGTYKAQFNASSGQWTITSPQTNKQVSGKDSVTIDGMTVHFVGTAANQDTFTFSPLANAAAGMHLLINDPSQLAASLPQLAEALPANSGSALMTLNSSGAPVPASSVPSIKDIFNRSLSPTGAVGVKKDGVIASVPTGANNVTLYSLGDISAATFELDLKPPVTPPPTDSVTDPSTLHSLNFGPLNLTINSTPLPSLTLFPDGVPTDPATQANPAQALADEMNRVFETVNYPATNSTTTLGDALYASVNNGAVTINALGQNNVSYAAFQVPGSTTPILANCTQRAPAGDIDVLTREGVQIAGLTSASSSILKDGAGNPINSFSPDAMTPGITTAAESVIGDATAVPPIAEVQTFDLSHVVTGPTTIKIGSQTIALSAADNTPDKVGAKIEAYFSSSNPSAPADWADKTVAYDPQTNLLSVTFANSAGKQPLLSAQIPQTETNYRNLKLVTSTSPITTTNQTTSIGRASTINFDVTPETDSPWTSPLPPYAANPGAVYSLKLAGVDHAIRLAGDAISGKNSTDIAAAMAQRVNALAPQRTIIGASVNLSQNTTTPLQITITLDGVATNVTFNRAIDPATGTYGPSGSFSVDGNPNIKVALATPDANNPSQQQIVISLPQQLTRTPPRLSIAGAGATALGLGGTVSEKIYSSGTTTQSLSDAQAALSTDFGISQNSVSITDDHHVVITNSLSNLANEVSLTPVSTSNKATRDEVAQYGFAGSDLTATVDGATLSISSAIGNDMMTGDASDLADTSASVSRIGQKLTISSTVPGQGVPEDLIVAVQGQTNGTRQIAATYPSTLTPSNPTLPDVEVEVAPNNQLKIYSLQTDSTGQLVRDANGNLIKGTLLATRNYISGEPVSYLGAQFTIDGAANVGDLFHITTDPNRTGDNRNAQALSEFATSDLFGKGSGSLQDIYTSTVGQVGSSSAAAQSAAASAQTVSDSITASYDSSTGVSLDTEAAELIKMQQAYQACAQIVSTAQELFSAILKAAGG